MVLLYQKSVLKSSEKSIGSVIVDPVERSRSSVIRWAGQAPLLVTRFISHRAAVGDRGKIEGFLKFRQALKVVRPYQGKLKHPEKRGLIDAFSPQSRRRLRFVCRNAYPELVSQFCLTYHEKKPDGKMVKKHLDSFLKVLRRARPDIGYLWILEFQGRGWPHFHVFFTVPPSPSLHKTLAEAWHRIAEPESPEHLSFHMHKKNFFKWAMKTGAYVTKYLDKQHQKMVPPEYGWSGRFWGSSRGLVPPPEVFLPADLGENEQKYIDVRTGEVFDGKVSTLLYRTLCRHQEATLPRWKGKKWARRATGNYTFQSGALIWDRAVRFAQEVKNRGVLQHRPGP